MLSVLGANDTYISDIDGDNIVGYFSDSSGNYHSFLSTVPEPSALSLLAVGLGGLAVMGRRRS